jgi:hypothetical protein
MRANISCPSRTAPQFGADSHSSAHRVPECEKECARIGSTAPQGRIDAELHAKELPVCAGHATGHSGLALAGNGSSPAGRRAAGARARGGNICAGVSRRVSAMALFASASFPNWASAAPTNRRRASRPITSKSSWMPTTALSAVRVIANNINQRLAYPGSSR